MVWGERWEGDSGWGTRVHPWRNHDDVWQNQYNIVKLKEKYYVGSRYLELKFLKIPFTIAPKNEIPNYTSNTMCTYLCLEDETVWEKNQVKSEQMEKKIQYNIVK